ncbi:caldesmon 1a isoform X4 [Silurus meridionalis]|uniref:caldesmon 1a isoform X4 n=1 Tax=Silurus meridionalis TaxID=175797 RepID=UPI001EE9B23B|nr:caldesmon 1a isoform X4 [Silurus meridionalis]
MDDFEWRREQRKQKREEMRLEAERMAYRRTEEDEEEAARERRRRARQDRVRNKEGEEIPQPAESMGINSHSSTVTETVSGSELSKAGEGDDEEQALLERLAKREERRQRRMMEALDRQKQLESDDAPSYSTYSVESSSTTSYRAFNNQEEEELAHNSKEEEKEEVKEEVISLQEMVEEKPHRSYMREQMEDEDAGRKSKQQNGGVYDDSKHKKVERTQSRGSVHSSEGPAAEEGDDGEQTRLEAERKLEELKRRRDETENEEFERMKQKQQEAEAELEELKRKREERRKVLEEEERLKKQEEAEKKAREEEEKRRMKEEIEKRRAEAAERRQKVEEEVDGEAKPFKCVSPRGSSLKIGERAEFLNRSAQKSAVKTSLTPVVSKIDNRLEQYTTAVQSNKEVRTPRVAAIDLPVVSDGVRNIKSMWEKGNVFSSGISTPSSNKDAAGIKVGVAGRINDWLNKTPETGKTPGGRPVDLKPGDVSGKRNLWENKGSSATKVTSRGESKSVANGMGH